MDHTTQISVSISSTTRAKLDRISNERGIRKNHLVEQALSQYLDQLEANTSQAETVKLSPEQIALLNAMLDAFTPQPPNEHLLAYLRKAKNTSAPDPMEFVNDIKNRQTRKEDS